jgi:hypothetical protein
MALALRAAFGCAKWQSCHMVIRAIRGPRPYGAPCPACKNNQFFIANRLKLFVYF